jgi:glycosyltransferase involved in cell wall biosynthesis
MHLVLLHGYLLQGTGSNIYVANVARAWKRAGHAVTVVCQDLGARTLLFVDEYVGPDEMPTAKPPEPFGMLAAEAMSAGVLPICTYHTGLRDVVDAVEETHPELAALMRLDRNRVVEQLPVSIEAALRHLYPEGFGDGRRRRQIAEQLREIAVQRFSWDGIARRFLGD